MFGITSSEHSVWNQAVGAATIAELVSHVPSDAIVVIPSTKLRQAIRRSWARIRAHEPVPQLVAMPQFHLNLLQQGDAEAGRGLITDAEAAILLSLAVNDTGLPFSPPGITASRIIRWKQEGETPDHVEYQFPRADRPYDLRQLDHVLSVWRAYEARKRSLMDRGDLAQRVVNMLARDVEPMARKVLVLSTHGLSRVDRLLLMLLHRKGWDVGIHFALHVGESTRTSAEVQWLVAHGWHHASTSEWKAPLPIVVKASSPTDEVRRILGAIKEYHAQGIALGDMCIVLPDGGPYEDLLLEHAVDGVPLGLQRRRNATSAAEATLVHSVCMVAVEGWTRPDVLRLAAHPLLGEKHELRGLTEAVNVLRASGGRGAKEWQDLMREQSTVNVFVRTAIQALVRYTSVFTLQGTAQQFVKAMTELAAMLDVVLTREVQESLYRYASYDQRLGLPPLSLRTHLSQWWRQLSEVSLPSPPIHAGSVHVLKANELRMQRFKVVFAPGIVEGLLPQIARDTLDAHITGIEQKSLDMERWSDICQAATDGTFVVTWPAATAGEPSTKSEFLCDIDNYGIDDYDIDDTVKTGVQALDGASASLLLNEYEVRALVEGAGRKVDTRQLQRGLERSELTAETDNAAALVWGKPLSPTRLDTMVACPYKYYASYLLGLEQPDETDESITPLERGSLMHAVAQRFFEAVRGTPTIEPRTTDELLSMRAYITDDIKEGITAPSLESLMSILVDIYHDVRKEFARGYLYDAVEESLLLDRAGRPGVLRRWLAFEQAEQAKQEQEPIYRPALFEVEYKSDVQLDNTRTEPVNLRIDRIDIGIEDGQVYAVVWDYKLTKGSIPEKRAITSGERTQPALYVKAAQAWFDDRGLDVRVKRMGYRTVGKDVAKTDDPKSKIALPIEKSDVEALEQATVTFGMVEEALDRIRHGGFPVQPIKGACEHCFAAEICRVESWGEYVQ